MSAKGKLRMLENGRVAFMCPGCRELHQVRVSGEGRPMWTWNGLHEAPTFSPSVLVQGVQTVKDADGEWTGDWVLGPDGKPLPQVCHSFVTDGRIQFLSDCSHQLAGQTVDLPDVA
jgi:hypothetical protein